jgi:hypothetical protein
MKKIVYLFIFLFLIVACTDLVKDTKIEKDTNIFISKTHGEIAIFPTFKYLGVVDLTDFKAHRKYFIWENNYENKYILITQIIVKGDKFPPNIQWINPNGAIFTRGMRGAYTSISNRPKLALEKVGASLPDCFILAFCVLFNNVILLNSFLNTGISSKSLKTCFLTNEKSFWSRLFLKFSIFLRVLLVTPLLFLNFISRKHKSLVL